MLRSRFFSFLVGFSLVGCSASAAEKVCADSTASSVCRGDSVSLLDHMPELSDQVHLAWVDGPPQLQAFLPEDEHLAGFQDALSTLGIRSGSWGMVFNPRTLELSRLTLTPTTDPVAELLDRQTWAEGWESARLELALDYRGVVYTPEGGPLPTIEENYKYSPVHIIESGPWYQHIAVYDLVLRNEEGEALDAESWLELRAWGDQLLIEWFVQPEQRGFSKQMVKLVSAANGVERVARSLANSVQLSIAFEGASDFSEQSGVAIEAHGINSYADEEPVVRYSSTSDAWEVFLPKQDWDSESQAAYAEEFLDRVSKFGLKLSNQSDEVREVRLRMIHDYHPITGYVPMFFDAKTGEQTGLLVQNSKNWHVLADEPYPYEGTWINQTTRLKLAPNSELELRYDVVHALWHELPASSAAQLSLVGWGFNGFWTQMALGAWGESVCLQPGRTMRRAFITDVRPFMVRSMYDMYYDWTSNMGGADLLKIVDAQGRYIPWVGSVTDYKMIGPNLSHVRVDERTADGSMKVQVDTFLPRSDSVNRSYFKVRVDVLEDLDVSHVALFQLGTDYYNDARSGQFAWGQGDTLVELMKPKPEERTLVGEPQPLLGEDPWICLLDNRAEAKNVGQGVRGLVLRSFSASIGGEQIRQPEVQANWVRWSLGGELQLPKSVTRLHAGDTIEMDFELLILPLNDDMYFGTDEDLEARLKASPDSWKLVAHEASQQQFKLNGERVAGPVTIDAASVVNRPLVFESTGVMTTLTITGLPDAGTGWELVEQFDGRELAHGVRFPLEAGPQLNFDLDSRTWTAVVSVEFTPDVTQRRFVLRTR